VHDVDAGGNCRVPNCPWQSDSFRHHLDLPDGWTVTPIDTVDPGQTVLDEAQRLIYGDRQQDYGPPTDSFLSIARLWDAYLATRYQAGLRAAFDLDPHVVVHLAPLTPTDVAHMMILLKVSRNTTGGYKRDNPVDIAGYAGCIERVEEDK
jgi:hypothetical protein